MGDGKAHTGFWWGDLRGKRSLGRPRHRQDNIQVDLQDVGWADIDWIYMGENRDRWRALVSVVMKLRIP